MAVDGDEAVGVIDDDDVAEPPPGHALAQRIATGEADHAVGRGVDRGAGRRGEIESLVEVFRACEGRYAHAERRGENELIGRQGKDRRRVADDLGVGVLVLGE